MKKIKVLKYLCLILVLGGIAFTYLANRDITKIYGGLTERVDVTQFERQTGPIVIENVNVLSPNSDSFITGQTVTVDEGVIVSISTKPNTSTLAHVINGEGKFLIPGLIDSHVHLFKSPNDLLLYVANGITQIRELIGEEDHLAWKDEIVNGRIGPDMFIASPRIGSFGGLEGFFMEWSQGFLNIRNASQAEQEVKKLHKQGYDAVKIYSQINEETYKAVAKTAKSLEMKVVGHVPWSLEISELFADQDSIAHLEEIMNAINREFGGFKSTTSEEFLIFVEQRSAEIAANLREHDIAVSTTLWLVESFIRQKFDLANVLTEVELEYQNPGISEWTPRVPQGGLGWLPQVNRYQIPKDLSEQRKGAIRKYWQTYAQACQLVLKSLNRAGVSLMTGTDTNLPPTVPGFSLHDEFISLNKAGMSPAKILAAATVQPSKWLNNNAGQILKGKKANLVILDKNPLNSISHTKSINSVILNGRLLDRNKLDLILAAVKDANNSSRNQDISPYLK